MSLFLESYELICEYNNRDVLILGQRPTQEFGDTTITAEAIYPISFIKPNK